ncbi:hypothetical protein KP509_30G065100 [Ceratopteris richardii]|uniref:Uncharacterized protein n=1 Tax=Ceratopteris richardii TaxID=49495 RepID=A0A8T2R5I3_CERRI|nr:hypothetical protein KP509_30G065100 [Ceratopteris richardii]
MSSELKASRTHPVKPSKDVSTPAEELDLELSSDIKGILTALQQVRQKAHKDGQKKNKETIENLASEVKSQIDSKKQKLEREWQNLVKTATKTCKDYEAALQEEFAKYQAAKERFAKEKASHVQTYEDLFSKFEDEKDKLVARFEQQRKKDKTSFAELQKSCEEQIVVAENSLKKNKQEDKSFSILRQSLGSFLSNNSDDELDD